MPDLIKAYSDGTTITLEVSVDAVSDRGAKARAMTFLLRRYRTRLGNVIEIDVSGVETGRLRDRRVLVTVPFSQELYDLLKSIGKVQEI